MSVFGMKQKSYIHLCDAVQGIESLTFVTKDIVSWFNPSQQLSPTQALPPPPSQWGGEEEEKK